MCLANVIFYLAGTTRQGFDNNEDTFANFNAFKNSLNNAFCRTEELRLQSEKLLLTHTQQIGETSKSYIQDVLSLCRKANPSMSEDEKVAHLMKGIAEDLYQTLLVQDFRRVDEFVKRCRETESLRRRRITRTRFQRLPNVSAVSGETDVGDIRSLIREHLIIPMVIDGDSLKVLQPLVSVLLVIAGKIQGFLGSLCIILHE
ncbi:hypothetical protein AVEN_6740-1 [Araneus ventricosus]|uniref:Retrotransposon gag domain-containing protein n=1 Tax=Araneus ventricosus TaxID=182803 RepID=A0A4Y2RD98_ARAVE|nr:hypothetical protein AVEN_6740-1 [Araneus ventricosus]